MNDKVYRTELGEVQKGNKRELGFRACVELRRDLQKLCLEYEETMGIKILSPKEAMSIYKKGIAYQALRVCCLVYLARNIRSF